MQSGASKDDTLAAAYTLTLAAAGRPWEVPLGSWFELRVQAGQPALS
jgi:hypothetical protein